MEGDGKKRREFSPSRAGPLVATGLVLLAGVLAFGFLAADPFMDSMKNAGPHGDFLDDLFHNGEGEDKESKEDPRLAACSVACDRIVECGMIEDVSLCLPWCVDEWTAQTLDCIGSSSCDRIEETCFEKTEEEVCEDVCAHLSGCGWLDLKGPACVEFCVGEWTREDRECLMSSGCAAALDHCLNLEGRVACPQVCDKLSQCGQIFPAEFPACVQMCEDEMSEPGRDCVMAYECRDVQAVCMMGNLPEDMCTEACSVVLDCELSPVTQAECLTECEEQWDEDLALCLIDNRFCEDATECFAEPGVQCSEFCTFLISCGELDQAEYPACVQSCPDGFTEDERQCVMAADCSSVKACLAPSPNEARLAACPDACSKLAGCRFIDMTAQLDCIQNCMDNWSDLQVNCVLNNECPSIGRDCLAQQTAPSIPLPGR